MPEELLGDGSFIPCSGLLHSRNDSLFCLKQCVATTAMPNIMLSLIFSTYVLVHIAQCVHSARGQCTLITAYFAKCACVQWLQCKAVLLILKDRDITPILF